MTGCGCLAIVAGIVALIALFVRASFDAGEPIQQGAALAAALCAIDFWRRERPADLLVRVRGA